MQTKCSHYKGERRLKQQVSAEHTIKLLTKDFYLAISHFPNILHLYQWNRALCIPKLDLYLLFCLDKSMKCFLRTYWIKCIPCQNYLSPRSSCCWCCPLILYKSLLEAKDEGWYQVWLSYKWPQDLQYFVLFLGSTFPKTKPVHTWFAVTQKGLIRVLLFPFFRTW